MITYNKNDLLELKEKLKSSEEVTLFKIYYKDYLNQFIRLSDEEKTGDKGGKIRGELSGTCRKYRHFIIKELTKYIISFLPIFSFSVIQHIQKNLFGQSMRKNDILKSFLINQHEPSLKCLSDEEIDDFREVYKCLYNYIKS